MFKRRRSAKTAPSSQPVPDPNPADELQMQRRLAQIYHEFEQGFDFLKSKQKSVTVFGSAIYDEDNPYYKRAYYLSKRIAGELGCTVITGGGPGIMEAANRGARDGKGDSYGIAITLPNEQSTNPYTTRSIQFHHFFARKVVLSFTASAFIYFPGGFGTLDEFFEIMTLVHTEKIKPVPIILVGTDYWSKLDGFIRHELAGRFKTVGTNDHQLYHITDSDDDVIELIKQSPVRN